ncbi:hypothetical protein SD427_08165 [Chryseobacterium sp. JJR-5R]|uniref:hypothetical protein n=1 Tax=Chryseobacterium sp. JJR-5R TaxID=3093923 RepID=UPI002A74BBFE|nr:hypothetical protein [Chryseobacterium sp. JJR-5R]WPO84297.1 hypothetical protein SD427_08165 [Chryseobacterium sp. JJR-5R]
MMSGDMFGFTDLIGTVFTSLEPDNQEQAIGFAALAIIATKGRAASGIIKAESNLWKVVAYNEMKGLEAGLQAHHVGQKSLMTKFVSEYNMLKAPSILVPELGHVKNIPGLGRMEITRGIGNFTNARQVIARDIFKLRRVYGSQGIPNSALQELIQMNKTMCPSAFIK